MAKCNCGAQTCGCRIVAGEGVTLTGAGTPRDPWVLSAEGGGGGASGWAPGDLKDTVRTVTDAGWLECNGQAVSRSTYASLFSAIGTTWGTGDGEGTFNLPNFAGVFRRGAGAGFPAGSSGGAASNALTVENLPPHVHTISHNHTLAHTHTINHDHGATTTTADGSHRHSAGQIDNVRAGTGANTSVIRPGENSYDTTTAGVHTHIVNLPAFAGSSGGASNPTTSGPNVPNSGSTGSGASFTNLPPFRTVRVLIKT